MIHFDVQCEVVQFVYHTPRGLVFQSCQEMQQRSRTPHYHGHVVNGDLLANATLLLSLPTLTLREAAMVAEGAQKFCVHPGKSFF